MDYIIYIYIYIVMRFTYFCEKGGGAVNFGSLFSFITAIFVFSVMTSLSSVETPVDRGRFVFSSFFLCLLGFISDDYSFVVAFVVYIFTWICICIFRCTFRLSIDVSASLIFLVLITVPVISFLL